MISLPLLDRMDVEHYGLYPGEPRGTGLHLSFEPGLTLVLGANGLGKTTLVTMLYRMLTGPFEIAGLADGTDLGGATLRVTRLQGRRRRVFGERVGDGGENATAKLAFRLGGEEVAVERSLRDLTLRSLEIGGDALPPDENRFQDEISALAGVSAFTDWILLLRYIVFYFETRRSLVWDPTAQRQLLRILFLERDDSASWTDRERNILQADTRVRNLQAVVTREVRALSEEEELAASEPEKRQALRELSQLQEDDSVSLDERTSALADIEEDHENSRLHFLTVEQERESLYRELERAQLLAISSRLPQQSESAQYILAQLLTDSECLACGEHVPDVVRDLHERIRGNECIICGSQISGGAPDVPRELAVERVGRREADLQRLDQELEAARSTANEAEGQRRRAVAEVRRLRTSIAEREAHIDRLIDQLPSEEGDLRRRRQQLATWQSRVEVMESELEGMRESFERIVRDASAAVARQAARVQEVFERYARRFLFEDCYLNWAPNAARLGQGGQRFDFPAFGLELGGSDFSGTVRRSGPEDVSESQREFIDISFRMALAEVAEQGGRTSLVMDAPESSLDAVFVERAARVLGTFGRREAGNRLVVTSNLIQGQLIPELLKQAADEEERAARVVDLLSLAAHTAAIAEFREDYERARDDVLARAEAVD